MARGTIPVISIVILNFDEVQHYDDSGIFNHLVMTCRLSRKRIIPKSVRYNAFRVSRLDHAVTVHLHLEEKETARISFVAAPDFSQFSY